jgi:4-coumarate--CoA ligase
MTFHQMCLISLILDVMELRIRELGSQYVLTDYARAGRVVDVIKRLDFVREIFVIGDKPVDGCTLFSELLENSGDGKHLNFPQIFHSD